MRESHIAFLVTQSLLTGTSVLRMTCSVTLPRSRCSILVRPCVPITTGSTSPSVAYASIRSSGVPSKASVTSSISVSVAALSTSRRSCSLVSRPISLNASSTSILETVSQLLLALMTNRTWRVTPCYSASRARAGPQQMWDRFRPSEREYVRTRQLFLAHPILADRSSQAP